MCASLFLKDYLLLGMGCLIKPTAISFPEKFMKLVTKHVFLTAHLAVAKLQFQTSAVERQHPNGTDQRLVSQQKKQVSSAPQAEVEARQGSCSIKIMLQFNMAKSFIEQAICGASSHPRQNAGSIWRWRRCRVSSKRSLSPSSRQGRGWHGKQRAPFQHEEDQEKERD